MNLISSISVLFRLSKKLTVAGVLTLFSICTNIHSAAASEPVLCATVLTQAAPLESLSMERLYQGDGARRFEVVSANGREHAPSDFEYDVLTKGHLTSKLIETYQWKPTAVRLVDFGPGNGTKAVAIAKDLFGAHLEIRSVTGVDVSD